MQSPWSPLVALDMQEDGAHAPWGWECGVGEMEVFH